ncbi:MAG: hypothetical protein WBL35_14515 [Ornithinibacter sp.]
MNETQPIPLSADERTELERLRSEVAQLREQPSGQVGTPANRHRVRGVAAALVITLGCLLTPLSVTAVWLSTQLTSTDAYVQTVAPLIDEPAVQEAIATSVTTEVFARLDVQDATTEALQTLADRTNLPPLIEQRLVGLSVPITNGVEGFVSDQVDSLVASEDFSKAWVDANRVAHDGFVAALTGGSKNGTVAVDKSGQVSINVAPFITIVQQRLVDRGFTVAEKIPSVDASFVIFQSADLARAQTIFAALDTLGTVFPFIVIAVLAAGVLLAIDRRRALVGVGLGVAGAMVLLGVLLALARAGYLNAVPADVLPRDAATLVFDQLVSFLRIALRTVLLLGLVVAAAAYVAGPSGLPVKIRGGGARGFAAVRELGGGNEGLAGAGVGHAVRAARRPLQVIAVIVAALTMVFWDRPTPAVLIGVVLVLLVFLGLLEVFGSGDVPPEETASSAAEDPAVPSAGAGADADGDPVVAAQPAPTARSGSPTRTEPGTGQS